MSEELRLWTVSESGEVDPLSPISEMPTEVALEDLLVRNPEMLEHGLKLVGQQTPTQTGWLDLLAVDRDGRLVVYELKRGTLVREAVTQVLDYASDLDAMNITDLAEHVAAHSGSDGIPAIDDFEQWYADNFGGVDLSRLLPPRMVLIGLGVDSALERMARFISGGPVDVSVVTFQGFMRGEDRLLARQMEVQSPQKPHGYPNAKERHRTLRERLVRDGFQDLFERVHDDLRQSLPERGVWEQPGATGIGFQLTEPDDPKSWKTYIGVQAGYFDPPAVYSVSILPQAIHWGEAALERLRQAIELSDWPYGGYYFSFASEKEWDELRPAVLDFVAAVMANREAAGPKAPET